MSFFCCEVPARTDLLLSMYAWNSFTQKLFGYLAHFFDKSCLFVLCSLVCEMRRLPGRALTEVSLRTFLAIQSSLGILTPFLI